MSRLIILLIMAALLFAWVIFMSVLIFNSVKKAAIAKGIKAHVECQKCGLTYDVLPEEYARMHMQKSYATIRRRWKNGAMIIAPKYKFYAMKCMCPSCGKMEYAQVLNANEIAEATRPRAFIITCKGLLLTFIGGLLIVLLMLNPLKLEEKSRVEKIQQVEDQQYEEFQKELGYTLSDY